MTFRAWEEVSRAALSYGQKAFAQGPAWTGGTEHDQIKKIVILINCEQAKVQLNFWFSVFVQRTSWLHCHLWV
jgi:hypothetical protein